MGALQIAAEYRIAQLSSVIQEILSDTTDPVVGFGLTSESCDKKKIPDVTKLISDNADTGFCLKTETAAIYHIESFGFGGGNGAVVVRKTFPELTSVEAAKSAFQSFLKYQPLFAKLGTKDAFENAEKPVAVNATDSAVTSLQLFYRTGPEYRIAAHNVIRAAWTMYISNDLLDKTGGLEFDSKMENIDESVLRSSAVDFTLRDVNADTVNDGYVVTLFDRPEDWRTYQTALDQANQALLTPFTIKR